MKVALESEVKIPTLSQKAREGWGTRLVFHGYRGLAQEN